MLDAIQKNQKSWDEELRTNLNIQTESSQTLETLLSQQILSNTAEEKMVKNLEVVLSDLQKTLQNLNDTRNTEANITASCKNIVHSFSLMDPFFW